MYCYFYHFHNQRFGQGLLTCPSKEVEPAPSPPGFGFLINSVGVCLTDNDGNPLGDYD